MIQPFSPRLVNGQTGDCLLFVDCVGRGRGLCFDLGRAEGLAPGEALRVTDAFVSHTHIDHFIGFDTLLRWHEQLAARGGWLIVDEAFMDATPEQSLAACSPQSGLIVLRSLGKFFGLAGARVGFAIAEPILLARLNALLGPWTVASPARWLATQALRDHAWREAARYRLVKDSARLAALLATHSLAPNGSCALFQWICTSRAAELHDRLARRGILARRFDDPASLRFGLPGNEPAWKRLDAALLTVCRTENREVVA